jgi:hypothetical protein
VLRQLDTGVEWRGLLGQVPPGPFLASPASKRPSTPVSSVRRFQGPRIGQRMGLVSARLFVAQNQLTRSSQLAGFCGDASFASAPAQGPNAVLKQP